MDDQSTEEPQKHKKIGEECVQDLNLRAVVLLQSKGIGNEPTHFLEYLQQNISHRKKASYSDVFYLRSGAGFN